VRMRRVGLLDLVAPLIGAGLFVAGGAATAEAGLPKKDPAFASSANDPILIARIAALSPTIDETEAQLVAHTAYTTGRDFKREWKVVWPPGVQNFLVNTGRRKGGLCFQWATELLIRLHALKLQTIELHWAEAFPRTASEHNVIVVTAKNQPFTQGIILDNWRYGGRLVWGPVTGDPHYEWKENPREVPYRLNRYAPRATPASNEARSQPEPRVPVSPAER